MRSGSPLLPEATVRSWVLTRDPVADRIGSVVMVALTRTRRGLASELTSTAAEDSVSTERVANFDNIHTIPRDSFRRKVIKLRHARLIEACRRLRNATGRGPSTSR